MAKNYCSCIYDFWLYFQQRISSLKYFLYSINIRKITKGKAIRSYFPLQAEFCFCSTVKYRLLRLLLLLNKMFRFKEILMGVASLTFFFLFRWICSQIKEQWSTLTTLKFRHLWQQTLPPLQAMLRHSSWQKCYPAS